jgi:hypothetical protein
MVEKKFSTYEGKWPCKTCQEVVKTLRLYAETGDATWLCSQKHISKVNLIPTKKTKKDFINE